MAANLARAAEGNFGVADGEFCISQGSSGWTYPDGKQVRFTEIVKQGGNCQSFGKPPGGLQFIGDPLNKNETGETLGFYQGLTLIHFHAISEL